MTTHEPTREPLDENEREFARVVRALPGGEPTAALDARILKAAQDAVAAAPSRRRARSWAAGGALWGIGSAAAAVLAIGIGWQMLAPPSSNLPVPATRPSTASAPMEESGTTVEFKDEAPRAFDNSPPPPSDAIASPSRPSRAPLPPPPPPAAPPPPAMEAPSPFIDEHVAANSAASDSAVNANVASTEADARQMETRNQDIAARSSGLVGKVAESESRRERALDQAAPGAAPHATVAAPAPAATRPTSQGYAAKADYRGKPANWLAHIRQLRDAEDFDGARESLRNFRKRYPDYIIPTDLAPLLRD